MKEGERWFYYLWLPAFTTGRVYGKKASSWDDELPRYVSDLKGFLYHLEQGGAPFLLKWAVRREIKYNEKFLKERLSNVHKTI